MTPNLSSTTLTVEATSTESKNFCVKSAENEKPQPETKLREEWEGELFKTPIIWKNVISIAIFHIMSIYTLLTFPYLDCKRTILWGVFVGMMAGFGITGGVHRYWTHRSFKANIPLRIILLICFCTAGQNSVYNWVRDHRVHHKFSETDADPHNSNRGFFFSHVGWLMTKKHPEVLRKGRQIDMSDVLEDPVVQFGEKYFLLLKLIFAFLLPILVPVYFWNETWYISSMSQLFVRYVAGLNITWSVNSAAHLWGSKPYDKSIAPVENMAVAYLAMGEGWHNYHHVFPWDYKAAELGNYSLNSTTAIIDMFAKIGWAYDLKQPSKDLIERVALQRGDGSREHWAEVPEPKSE
ncbi:acyl-CoA Delta(11) desaturase isoform X2 [Orussus abietinus]|nr:acyl-CoA Delta(11) desaturase isoform X2 [Orussus abietinus]XP_012276759.1 acyl-CoA Delta(11) desaturase isoform X2 [Orussus abietinus]